MDELENPDRPTKVDLPLPVTQEFAYLTYLNGSQAGTRFQLTPELPTRIGRGVDCMIMLNDPISSRVHAIVKHEHDEWMVYDNQSRNGTYLDGIKIESAPISHGRVIKIGAVELIFEISREPLTMVQQAEAEYSHTVVRQQALAELAPSETVQMALAAFRDTQQTQQLLLLYQLSIRLLGCDQPDEVIRIALDLLRDQTRATSTAFYWVDDNSQLRVKLMLPEGSVESLRLSDSLSALVSRQGQALWINKQQAGQTNKNMPHFADALCIPLVSMKQVVGAIVAYMDRGKFQQLDFDFGISLANILAVALVRARQQMTMTEHYRHLLAKHIGCEDLIGESPAMQDLKERITRLANARGSVLIRGESGVGKELVARAIHRAGPRADRPMLSVNCAAIPHELMESQLFGHKAGAFTGADRDHQGYFQQADTGTLFLDEVGELTLEGQAKLLRILEGHPFMPVGSNKEITVDVRVIAATNRDLQAFVREKKFREDLYYRLTVFELLIPSLRERGTDVERLIEHFFNHFRKQHARSNLKLSAEAKKKLLSYNWPGNVRQLKNVLDSAVVLAAGPEIQVDDLPLRESGLGSEIDTLRIDVWERKLMVEALKRVGGNVPEAAKLLGLSRATLYRKLEEYEIEKDRLPAEM
jgi:two-component system, NtrC family, response regulator HydG